MGATFSPAGGRSKVEFIVWWILYVVTTLLFFIFGCIDLAWADGSRGNGHWDIDWIWTLGVGNKGCDRCDTHFGNVKGMIYFLYVLFILLALFVTVCMCLKGTVIKDNKIYDMAFGQWGRFLPIPILLEVGLECITVYLDEEGADDKNWYRNVLITALVFNIVCLALFIIIYIKMGDCGDSILAFVFKKGFVSFSIAYHGYYFFDTVILLAKEEEDDYKDHNKRFKAGSGVSMILLGILAGLGCWFWKDIVLAAVTMFFEMGIMVLSAKAKKYPKRPKGYPKKAYDEAKDNSNDGYRILSDLIISTIMWILLLVLIVIVIVVKKKEVLK